MRFWAPLVALFASVALAQQYNNISIPAGQSTLEVVAGQPFTITWGNPSSGTVTIKLQQFSQLITPETGRILGSGIPASDGTATFTIDPADVNSFQYAIEIIDDTNEQNYNFSPPFGIQGATGTSTAIISSASATGSSASASGSSASASGSSASASGSAAASSSAAASASASNTDSSSASRTSSAAVETTSAPSDGGAAGLKAQLGLMALLAVAVAVL